MERYKLFLGLYCVQSAIVLYHPINRYHSIFVVWWPSTWWPVCIPKVWW